MSGVALRSKDLVSFNRYILCEGIVLDFDVFTTDTSNPHIRNIRKGMPISVEVEKYASTNKALKLYIHPTDVGPYRSLLESIANNTHDTRVSRSGLFRDAACMQLIRDTFTSALGSGETHAIFDSAVVNAERLIQWFDVKTPLKNVLDVLESTVNWQDAAINTAIVCTYFAHSLGARGNALQELARGALLADIGYLDVDASVLQSFNSPTIEDQRKRDAHPTLGLKRLANVDRASWILLMLVYQHHESLDKRGFPVGIPGDQISDAAKMYTIIDRFMHFGGNSHPFTSEVIHQAMCKLESELGTRISKEHFQCWRLIVQSVL